MAKAFRSACTAGAAPSAELPTPARQPPRPLPCPKRSGGEGFGVSHLAQPPGSAPLHQQLRVRPSERGRAELQGAERQRQPRSQHPSGSEAGSVDLGGKLGRPAGIRGGDGGEKREARPAGGSEAAAGFLSGAAPSAAPAGTGLAAARLGRPVPWGCSLLAPCPPSSRFPSLPLCTLKRFSPSSLHQPFGVIVFLL